MITYFRMKQYLKQAKLSRNLYNFALRAIYIDINSIMFSQSVFTVPRPDLAIAEARPCSQCRLSCCSCAKCLKCVTLLSQTIRNKAPDIRTRYRYLQSLQLRCWEILLKLWCWSSQGKLFLIKWSMRSKADFHLSDCTIQWVLCLQMQCYGITQ